MISLITGDTKTLKQYMPAVVNMQAWIKADMREGWISRASNMRSKVILAVDDRHRLVGSFLFFPSINDPWVREVADRLPFDAGKAFTITLVWVHESQRGKGLGRRLFAQAHDMAQAQGLSVRFGYGAATPDIWSFTRSYSSPTIIEGLEFEGKPVQYTNI